MRTEGTTQEPYWEQGGWAASLGMLHLHRHNCLNPSTTNWWVSCHGPRSLHHGPWQTCWWHTGCDRSLSCLYVSVSNDDDFKTLNCNCGQISKSLHSRIRTGKTQRRMHAFLSCSQGLRINPGELYSFSGNGPGPAHSRNSLH